MKKTYLLKSFIILLLLSGFISNAQVGIGTANPLETLHVQGTLRVTSTNNIVTTTKLAGTNNSGTFSDITIGENISLVGNVLSANAGKYGIANIPLSAPSSNTVFDNLEINVAGSNINNTIFRFTFPPGASSGYSIRGISGGTDGRHIILYNTSSANMSIDNLQSSTPANSIDNLGSATATSGVGTVELVYDGVTQKWLVINIRN